MIQIFFFLIFRFNAEKLSLKIYDVQCAHSVFFMLQLVQKATAFDTWIYTWISFKCLPKWMMSQTFWQPQLIQFAYGILPLRITLFVCKVWFQFFFAIQLKTYFIQWDSIDKMSNPFECSSGSRIWLWLIDPNWYTSAPHQRKC